MEQKLHQLKARLSEIHDLRRAAEVLSWDQETYMPPGGAEARGRQVAILKRLAHEKGSSDELGSLLADLGPWAEAQPYDSDEAALLRQARHDFKRRTRVPAEFIARQAQHESRSFAAWAAARPRNDFAAVRPFLKKTVDLSRELAGFFPDSEHVADPLIDEHDQGVTVRALADLFGRLRAVLVPLVQEIMARPQADDSCLHRGFPAAGQRAFFEEVVRAFGFDAQRGRIDTSPHPFTSSFSIGDVRFTVRYKENELGEALFSAFHEAGHAMYEQGVQRSLEGLPLARGASAGVHESQSRLWENLVGRSRPFWSRYYPVLQERFPAQLGDVSVDTFYRAVNKVQPSLIRTDADEVTYNLHVMIRFDLELALLEGRLAVGDLPDAWRERYRTDLGIVPPDDRDGVLQDVHWYSGPVGGVFQGYTLGNVMGAQFYAAALKELPEIPSEIEKGRFEVLHGWLAERIYRHGMKLTATELLERATGSGLRIEPYCDYLRGKFSELYGL